MGVVAEHLKKKLTESVRSGGLLIWLDREHQYTCLHMPGFNETHMKETPLLEAYKAGQRWRISLDTLIRESARGRFSQEQVNTFLPGIP